MMLTAVLTVEARERCARSPPRRTSLALVHPVLPAFTTPLCPGYSTRPGPQKFSRDPKLYARQSCSEHDNVHQHD